MMTPTPIAWRGILQWSPYSSGCCWGWVWPAGKFQRHARSHSCFESKRCDYSPQHKCCTEIKELLQQEQSESYVGAALSSLFRPCVRVKMMMGRPAPPQWMLWWFESWEGWPVTAATRSASDAKDIRRGKRRGRQRRGWQWHSSWMIIETRQGVTAVQALAAAAVDSWGDRTTEMEGDE